MSKLQSILSAMLFATIAAAIPVASARAADQPIWNIVTQDQGVVTATNNPNGSAMGTYKLTGDAAFSKQTWTFATIAPETRDYTFTWDYSGFHSFYEVYVELDAFGGAAGANTSLYAPPIGYCCESPSSAFSEKGIIDFGIVEKGASFGFNMHGSNFDSARTLQGQLSVTAVPEPETYALMGVGLIAIAWLRRRSLMTAA